jgi:hypothetical protein
MPGMPGIGDMSLLCANPNAGVLVLPHAGGEVDAKMPLDLNALSVARGRMPNMVNNKE